ncbi:HTH_Tnp_Tc3_2 domain-containing protein [Trichonephila clavipes]|uniref:HTH_Tnp_Tc3_2 domain-containing protein n=1 Tax=Trichonephila clavipes TaxID=2585209 RepID=A0A8X6RCH8_TRICX|nr:HTH_Tnp_Tc3_2 domain-containing protein [Trichonephila clavipes]
MPCKRARRHFSKLSEFERGLIIGMKTANAPCCWTGGSCRYEKVPTRGGGRFNLACIAALTAGLYIVDTPRSEYHSYSPRVTHARKTEFGATRKTTRREDRRIVWQALVYPTVTRSTIRADVDVAIVRQTISRHLAEANLKSKRTFRALPLTPEHRQLRL